MSEGDELTTEVPYVHTLAAAMRLASVRQERDTQTCPLTGLKVLKTGATPRDRAEKTDETNWNVFLFYRSKLLA